MISCERNAFQPVQAIPVISVFACMSVFAGKPIKLDAWRHEAVKFHGTEHLAQKLLLFELGSRANPANCTNVRYGTICENDDLTQSVKPSPR